MTPPDTVQAEGLTCVYGHRYALKDVSFEWSSGTVAAVVGANGAGKTTLLGILAGRLGATHGQVLYGEEKRSVRDCRAWVGYLSHASFLYEALTCRENLLLVADLHGLTDKDRVDSLLERVGLAPHANRPVSDLSRGMVQRLSIARVLLPSPRVVLLDEPTTGLDESGRNWLAETLRSLAADGVLVALASHSRSFLSDLATHALVLKRGRVTFSGAMDGSDAWVNLFGEHLGT
jgi:heme ABC exporter ATP-binding subunit CcmA